MIPRPFAPVLSGLLLAGALTACGQAGDLYLPETAPPATPSPTPEVSPAANPVPNPEPHP